MRFLTLVAAVSGAAALSIPRMGTPKVTPVQVADAHYDGKCYYPVPTHDFDVNKYVGKWYQVAGTPFGPTTGARCVSAEYSINDDGSVKVVNTATNGQGPIAVEGRAVPVDPAYGKAGVLKVTFPGQTLPGEACEGPNYIVQEYKEDHAIVQTQNWTTLYILSRKREPEPARIEEWINNAVNLGSNRALIKKFDQKDC